MTLPLDPNAFNNALSTALQGASAEDSEFHYLKMTKAGDWVFGQEEEDVQEGSIWAIDPRSIQKGFIAWDEGEKLGEEMASIFGEKPIQKEDLPDVGAKWVDQLGLAMACTNGQDKGVQCVYKVNSKGGKKAIRKYMSELQRQIQEDPEHCVALVTLDSEFYKHKEYGRIYNPIIEITGWVTMDTASAPASASAEPAPAEPADDDDDDAETPEKAPPARKRKRAVN